jgi:small-conductance mechanosensitive channel
MGIDQAIAALMQKLGRWAQDAVLMIPNLVVAILVVIMFWIAARIARNLVGRLLRRVTPSAAAEKLLSEVVYAALLVSGVFIALGILQLEKTVTSLLTGVGILGLTLGFALQDVTANLVAGVLIEARQPFRVGDVIETNEFCGRVDRITLRSTEMTKLDGQFVLIPNKDIFSKPVINHSASATRRVDVEIPISSRDNPSAILKIARASVAAIGGLAGNHEIELFFKNINETTMTLLVRFWITSKNETDYLRARSEAIQRVKDALDGHHLRQKAS